MLANLRGWDLLIVFALLALPLVVIFFVALWIGKRRQLEMTTLRKRLFLGAVVALIPSFFLSFLAWLAYAIYAIATAFILKPGELVGSGRLNSMDLGIEYVTCSCGRKWNRNALDQCPGCGAPSLSRGES